MPPNSTQPHNNNDDNNTASGARGGGGDDVTGNGTRGLVTRSFGRRRDRVNAKDRRKHRVHSSSSATTTTTTSPPSLTDYIPPYLRPWVHYYHGDFCYSRSFHPRLIVHLLAEGFLPIATNGGNVLLPKLHERRSVVRLQPTTTSTAETSCEDDDGHPVRNDRNPSPSSSSLFHVKRSIRKKAGRFRLTFNQCFDRVVEGCRRQHGEHCWLYDSLVDAFREIHRARRQQSAVARIPVSSDGDDDGMAAVECPVRLLSTEIWDDGALVAGELGYAVGAMYTSLTGFSARDSAGSVQLSVTGRLLQVHGFAWWDLGMDMAYKTDLGATLLSRDAFVRAVRRARTSDVVASDWTVPYEVSADDATETTHNCRVILDQTAAAVRAVTTRSPSVPRQPQKNVAS